MHNIPTQCYANIPAIDGGMWGKLRRSSSLLCSWNAFKIDHLSEPRLNM